MVLEVRKRLHIFKCRCGGMYQRENFKKHVQNARIKEEHGKVASTLYCCKCNVFGRPGESFDHDKCPYVRLPKDDMTLVLEGKPPRNRLQLIERREKEQEEMKKRKSEKKLLEAVEDEKAEMEEGESEQIRQMEVDRAVASIMQEVKTPVVDLGERVDLDLSSIADSSSPVGEEEEPPPLAKRRRLIVSEESSSESDFPNLTRTSTPKSELPSAATGIKRQQPYDPRRESMPTSQTLAKNNLVDQLSAMKKSSEEWRQKALTNRAKAQDYARLEGDLISQRTLVKELAAQKREVEQNAQLMEQRKNSELCLKEGKLQAALRQLQAEREDRERERESFEKRTKDLCHEKEELERALEKKEKQLRKATKALSAEKETEEAAILYHVACRNGRVVETRFDNIFEPNETSICYNDKNTHTNCHHIIIRRTPADSIKVSFQNTRAV